IVREPGEDAGDQPARYDDDRAPESDGERRDAEPVAVFAPDSAAPRPEAPASTVGSGPAALGKTMLGFAAAPTPRPPANTPRTAMPSAEPAGDEMAGMLLEGFR